MRISFFLFFDIERENSATGEREKTNKSPQPQGERRNVSRKKEEEKKKRRHLPQTSCSVEVMTKPFSEDMSCSLFASFSLSLSLFVNMKCALSCASLSQWKASSFLYARSRTEQREQRKQKTPLLSVVVYCGYDAVSRSVYCACVKAKRMGLSVKRFPLKLLLPFFSVLIGRFLVSFLWWCTRAVILSTCCYV